MATVNTTVLNLYTWNFPSITNRIRMSVFLQTDPQAFIASEIDSVVGHPERVWSFPGLPRNNYGVVLDEIDSDDNVVRQIAYFDVVPGEFDEPLFRDDEQIKVDTTPHLVSGTNTAVFDGTDDSPDYRGWDIVLSELTGRGIMVKNDLDYSWDSVTGTVVLLQTDDVFEADTWYNVHFNAKSQPSGNSVPTVFDFGIKIISSDTTLVAADFGKKLIIDPYAILMNITLPSIVTVPPGRRLMVEISGGSHCCAKFNPVGSDTINFLNGNLYAVPHESFTIYRLNRAPGVDEWRVCDADGNFRNVGQLVSEDAVALSTFNKKILDGSIELVDRYARLYNEHVLNLPVGQVVDYDLWSINKTFYSLANAADPTFAGYFRFPDRTDMFEKNNTSVGRAGSYEELPIGGSDSVIKTYLTNKYVLI